MAPQTAKSLMKEFRASFRRKKVVDPTPKIDKLKEMEAEEQAKLVELKEILGENLPPGYNDAALLGFIRARSLNVKDAIKLLKLDVNTKKFILLDTLLKEYDVTELSKNFKVSGVVGLDKEGSLVRIIKLGPCDVKGNTYSMSTVEHFKVLIWYIELDLQRQELENKKTGNSSMQILYILDLADLNISKILSKSVLDTGLVALKLFQDHYHDIAKSVFIVNTPSLFPSVYKVFKPVLRESLQQKIKIYGCDGYKEELLKHIDADVLPAYLGGNKLDVNDDPYCEAIIGNGGMIPKSYYPDHFLDMEDEDVIATIIPAGSSLSYRFHIPEEGIVIRYHIQAKDNDIGFGLFIDPEYEGRDDGTLLIDDKRKDEDVSKLEQIVPVIRSQCHICPEVGSFRTWFNGTLVFYLDNTYSWMSSKEVTFKWTVEPLSSCNKPVMNPMRNQVMVRKTVK